MSEPMKLEDIDDALVDLVVELQRAVRDLQRRVRRLEAEADLDFEVPDVREP